MTDGTRPCVTCGNPLSGMQKKHCSPLCASRALNAARKADGRLAAERERSREYRAEWQKANRQRLYVWVERPCAECSTAFTTRKDRPTRYCSARCRSLNIGRKPMSRVTKARRKMQVAERGTRGRRWAQGACRRCGKQFVASFHNDAPVYCSEECKRSDLSDRRRARKSGAFVERVYRAKVYERDGWRCLLCGKRVKRNALVPHPLAPTLDHVVPLFEGGEHSMANVQTAHFRCNSRKSHRGGGEQLALIG